MMVNEKRDPHRNRLGIKQKTISIHFFKPLLKLKIVEEGELNISVILGRLELGIAQIRSLHP